LGAASVSDTAHILFSIEMVSVIAYLATCLRLFSYLKENHEAVWDRLGRPSFLNNSIQNNILFLRFMAGRKWRDMNDPALRRLALTFYGLFALCAVSFASFAAVGFSN
jgi:hypothetical protein